VGRCGRRVLGAVQDGVGIAFWAISTPGVPSMFDSLEVKVLCPRSGGDEGLARRNVYVRSARAGHRVMASITLFITMRLKLKVNATKSAVDRHDVAFPRRVPGSRIVGPFSVSRCARWIHRALVHRDDHAKKRK